MQEYKLDSEKKHVMGGYITTWSVYTGETSHGIFIKEDCVFTSESITDCYTWIKATKEGLIIPKLV